jgi:hypothetical protein
MSLWQGAKQTHSTELHLAHRGYLQALAEPVVDDLAWIQVADKTWGRSWSTWYNKYQDVQEKMLEHGDVFKLEDALRVGPKRDDQAELGVELPQ